MTAIVLETFRLNGVLLDIGNQITKPYGLTSARWQVMGAIDMASQPLTVSQIARRMGLTRQGVQRIVNDLLKMGMIESTANIDHKRAPLIWITDNGKKVMSQINEDQTAWINQLSKGTSDRQLLETLEMLQVIRQRIEQP